MAFPPIIRNSQERDADQSTPTETWIARPHEGPGDKWWGAYLPLGMSSILSHMALLPGLLKSEEATFRGKGRVWVRFPSNVFSFQSHRSERTYIGTVTGLVCVPPAPLPTHTPSPRVC